jgi:DNA-binding response OmpR family regulator
MKKVVDMKSLREPEPHRVLVLEDDWELSAVIERVLRSIDSTLSLDWATSAEDAIEHLKTNLQNGSFPPYDLIVADIFLDGKSTGIDFWRTCQELFPETPVLITSALSLDRFFTTVGRQCISPPYLQKPFSINECKNMFESMLSYASKPHWNTKSKNTWLL